MPNPAQDRIRRGPFAALLILLGLVLGSANAAASYDLRGPASRLGSSRQGTAPALLPAGTRGSVADEASGAGTGPSLLPSTPGIVTERLSARPRAETPWRAESAVPGSPTAAYRARAPPAS